MGIVTKQVSGLHELVVGVLDISRNVSNSGFLWYRGHSRSSYKLIPKIMRDGKIIDQIYEREKRMLTRFRQRSVAYWPSGYPQSDWEQLFAMQHFGMPTRLLDWSENLFVAAHFALTGRFSSSESDDDVPVIWCINPIDWNRSTPLLSEFGDQVQVLTTADDEIVAYQTETVRKRYKSPVAIFGTHNSGRIVAQRGTFMVWGTETKPLEDFAGDSQTSSQLWRFELMGSTAELSRDLAFLGFGETMVFPELPSLAAELTRMEG